MNTLNMRRISALCAGLLAAACSPPPAPYGVTPPADAAARAAYAETITDAYKPAENVDLAEYFCVNALASPCPSDLDARLAPFRTRGVNSRLDLADAFTRMKAAADGGDPAAVISDEAYVAAAYLVVLGRPIDAEGGRDNLEFVARTGERKQMLRSLLQSAEFKS